jgi:hypothetical protein
MEIALSVGFTATYARYQPIEALAMLARPKPGPAMFGALLWRTFLLPLLLFGWAFVIVRDIQGEVPRKEERSCPPLPGGAPLLGEPQWGMARNRSLRSRSRSCGRSLRPTKHSGTKSRKIMKKEDRFWSTSLAYDSKN